MRIKLFALAVAGCLIASYGWAGDDWDYANPNDNAANTTQNRLTHGARQEHDLADQAGPVADEDWFITTERPRASYEVIADGYSGVSPNMTRYASDGTSVMAYAGSVDNLCCYAQTLKWVNTTSSSLEERVKVSDPSTGGTTYDRYDIRMYETTIFIARFNNSGTQTTVLLCQNPTESTINAYEYFWSSTGTLLATNNNTIAAHSLATISGVTGTSGQAGSITVAHDGGYGTLNCKSVALEPSTGFSFDTPGVYRAQ